MRSIPILIVAYFLHHASSTDVIGGVRAQPTIRTTTSRRQSVMSSSPSDDLIVSEVTTNCPFDDNINVLDCTRHELAYTDALLLPVSKIVSFTRNFARSSPLPNEDFNGSGREPCLQDDEDCDMSSGDAITDANLPVTAMRQSLPSKNYQRTDDILVRISSSTTTAAAIWPQPTSTSTILSATAMTSRTRKRRSTTLPVTPSVLSSSSTPMATIMTTSTSKSSKPSTSMPSLISTVTTAISSMENPRHSTAQLTARPGDKITEGSAGDGTSNGSGSSLVDLGPISGGVYGNGVIDIARLSEIERLKWNVGLIIAVATCLAILFLVLAFVIYRYRGIAGAGHWVFHHRHNQSSGTGCKVTNNDIKGGGYGYETCNTLPVTPVSTAPTRPLVINRSANITSSSVTATLLPQQHQHQQQASNGSRKEVKEWYV